MFLEAAAVRLARLALSGHMPSKAKITNKAETNPLKKTIRVLFNPEKIMYTRSVIYDHTPMPDEETGGRYTYVGGKGAKLTMTLLFDTTDVDGDVRDYTDFLVKLTIKDKKTGQPPLCKFEWGEFTKKYMKFDAHIADLDIDFTFFYADGTPARAECKVIFEEPDKEEKGTNPSSRSEARSVWTVVEGQTLDWIAYQEYGSSAAWRHIAQVNQLANPMQLRAGQVLKLTPLP